MFLSFGKKITSTKKPGSPVESSKSSPSSMMNLTADAMNGNSRSTVQTTAGPLLSSSRFNSILDASTFANVNSPGFTSRVVNCATSGSSYHENSATHHSKYSLVGLFPRVQLGGQSVLPTLSPRNSQKTGRTPVRVRIASPSLNERRRHSICGGSREAVAEKNQSLKRSPSLSQGVASESVNLNNLSENASSTVDNSQELSRKRMLSECHEPSDEAKKRRRKAEMPIPNPNNDIYRYRHVGVPAVTSNPTPSEMSSQNKRAREKGSPEEQKRQRRKTCSSNNAIFSSLSSSRNLLERLTALKRKVDISRPSSPSTPLIGKQVKESRTMIDLEATQCNLESVPQESSITENVITQDSTPISSRVVNKRVDPTLQGSLEKPLEKSSNKSHGTTNCDYTTKLFRKDIPSHSHRTSSSKTLKQSPWVKAPAADELTCSLLRDDSKLDRPERLKSLLACVSGKVDSKNQENKAVSSTAAASETNNGEQVSKPGMVLPSGSSRKEVSPAGGSLSSAFTVTVSSTCTVMTSATVTSVNGVPSSESGRSPPPRPVFSLPVQSILTSSPLTSTGATSETNVSTVAGSAGKGLSDQSLYSVALTPSIVNLPASTQNCTDVNALPAGTNETATEQTLKSNSKSPQIFQGAITKSDFNTFTMKSPVNNSQVLSGTVPTSIDQASKSAFQLGSNSSVTTSAVTTSNFSSSVQPSDTTVNLLPSVPQPSSGNSTFQLTSGSSISAPVPTFGSNSSVNKTFSFGSNESASSEATASGSNSSVNKTFSFGPNRSAYSEPTASVLSVVNSNSGCDTSVMPKSSLSFGPSLGMCTTSSEAPKSAFQFGSGLTTHQAAKPAFQFGSSTTIDSGSTEPSKPVLQFGLSGPNISSSSGSAKPTFQFGSNGTAGSTETSKPAFQFVPSSKGPSDPVKSTFQFRCNDSVPSDISKSMPQFGSISQSSAGTPKPAVSFGLSSGGAIAKSQSPFHTGTSNQNVTGSSSSTFQFGDNINNISTAPKPSFQFGSNMDSTGDVGKSSFQFGSSLQKPNDSSNANFPFSASASGTPANGSTLQRSGSAFGQVVQSQSKGPFAFGSSTNVNSGNENKSMFSFGSSGATANNSGLTPSSMFTASSSSPGFGACASTAQPTTPSFGAVSNLKSPGFGSTPSFGGTAPSTFPFNSNGSSAAGAGNANNTFQFGSTATTNVGGNAASFSFGQKQDPSPAGFGYNATVTAVPSPAPQAPGLFSIGSGPSTGQRRTTTARRRR